MRRSAWFRRALASALAAGLLCTFAPAHAAETPSQRQLTPEEIDAWLDSRAMPKGPRGESDSSADDSEAPPSPPRKRGFVLESTVGVLGQAGRLKNITPNAPWFGLRFGYEPLRWLMVFAESDLWVATTGYARQPPPPRSFVFWNVGGGVRLTLPFERFGVYLQGSFGGGRATEDVLESYGYEHAEELGFYQSAELGFEWYQVNPHLGLGLHGGVRNYPRTLERERDSEAPLAWLGGVALRYTF